MTRAPAPRRRPPAETQAAEWALGVFDAADREAAEARAAADPAFATDAAGWSARLHPLSEEAAPVEPSPELWARIEAALPPAAVAEPLPSPGPEGDGTLRETPVVDLNPHRLVRRWRRLAGMATGLAAACVVAVVVLLARHPVAPAPLLTARLDPPSGAAVLAGTALYAATVDPGRAAVVLTAVGPGPVDPRARELWVLAKPGAPTPVGVIRPGRSLRLPRAAAAAVRAGAALAVSLEPPGGSPTGAPTGPVIALGVLSRA